MEENTVVPPETPVEPQVVSAPAPGKNKQRKLLFISLALLVAAGAIAAALLFSHKENKTPSRPAAPAIMVSGSRYISACRTLPLADVEAIFEPLGKTGTFVETAQSGNYSTKETDLAGSISSQCEYLMNNSANMAVRIEVLHYISSAEAQSKWKGFADLGSGEAMAQLDRLEKDINSIASEDDPTNTVPAAKDFLKSTRELVKINEQEIGGKTVAGLDKSILYVAGTGEFVGLDKNLIIRISYKTGGTFSLFSDLNMTPKEFVTMTGRMKKAFDVAYKNVENTHLSQALTPTVISKQKKVGSLWLVEPCDVLTPVLYQKAFGEKPGRKVSTTSTFRDATASGKTSLGQIRVTGNQCTYQPEVSLTPQPNIFATVDVQYFADAATVKGMFERVKQNDAAGTLDFTVVPVQTTADDAIIGVSKKSGLRVLYAGYKSAYIVLTLSRSEPGVDGAELPLEQAQYVAAMNTVIANFKAAQERAGT